METYDWIRQIPSSLLQQDAVPLLGVPPTFPWKDFAAELAKLFSLKSLQIFAGDIQWRSANAYFEGIANEQVLFLQVGALEGCLAFGMSKDDLVAIMRSLLLGEGETVQVLIDQELIDGFYRFIGLEILLAISRLKFDPTLSLYLKEVGELPDESALCQDIVIELPSQTLTGRLIISGQFRQAWTVRYTPKIPDVYLKSPLAEKLDLPVHIQAGKVSLSEQEWEGIAAGDFVLLDSCGIDPKTYEGSLALLVNNAVLFQGSLQKGTIRLEQASQVEKIQRYEGVQNI